MSITTVSLGSADRELRNCGEREDKLTRTHTAEDPGHPVYNAIPGRYANRIGNGKYTLDGKTYLTEKNDGNNTLHSGTNNWSYRFWDVTEVTDDSITFSILDKANSSQGFPGDVKASVTYSVKGSTWNIKMTAEALDHKTRMCSLSSLLPSVPFFFSFSLFHSHFFTLSFPHYGSNSFFLPPLAPKERRLTCMVN